ncbi:hypothetical protein Tco_1387250 [Tanacetum coccineum]
MSSRVSNKVVNIAEPPRNSKSFFNSKNIVCPTRRAYRANHDACILQYLSHVNSCAFEQETGAQSSKTTKRYIPVEKKSDAKKMKDGSLKVVEAGIKVEFSEEE